MKRVFIIHGWGANPDCNWFPWLKKELEKIGFAVDVPAMPNSEHPKYNEWIECLKKIVGKADEETILVGHSLGAITILHYLNELPEEEKIGKAILVSSSDKNPGYSELAGFFSVPLDFEKIRKACDGFTVVHAYNDPVVPIKLGKEMSEALCGEFIALQGGEHLNAGNGFFELPVVLEKILE